MKNQASVTYLKSKEKVRDYDFNKNAEKHMHTVTRYVATKCLIKLDKMTGSLTNMYVMRQKEVHTTLDEACRDAL